MALSAIELPLEKIAEICRAHHVTELALFGSALSDDFRSDSDLDFLVVFRENHATGIFEYADLQLALAHLLRRKVDLVPKHNLKRLIRDDVLSTARVVYAAQ
jgi:predicted nucleotidyltransferase